MIDFLKRYNDSLKLKSSSQQIHKILNSRRQYLDNVRNNKLRTNNTVHINQTPDNLENLENLSDNSEQSNQTQTNQTLDNLENLSDNSEQSNQTPDNLENLSDNNEQSNQTQTNQTQNNLENLSNNSEQISYKKKRQYTNVNKIYKNIIYNGYEDI